MTPLLLPRYHPFDLASLIDGCSAMQLVSNVDCIVFVYTLLNWYFYALADVHAHSFHRSMTFFVKNKGLCCALCRICLVNMVCFQMFCFSLLTKVSFPCYIFEYLFSPSF